MRASQAILNGEAQLASDLGYNGRLSNLLRAAMPVHACEWSALQRTPFGLGASSEWLEIRRSSVLYPVVKVVSNVSVVPGVPDGPDMTWQMAMPGALDFEVCASLLD